MTSPQVALPAPSSRARRPFDFRIPITLCVIAVLCGFFWIGSRYPSLQGKASADPNEALSTPLGFERFFPEPPADQRLKHIGWTSVEWGITNRQGMTYGLLLAAAMMTVLPLIRRRRGGKLAGALQGMMIGTPLGVCVNCAAPIAQGMIKGGGRVETALATLVSSPTFNVIVLGIVFTLFPWYLAVLKILAGVFIVLVVVPWLARLSERPGWSRPQPVEARLPGLYLFQKLESLLGTPQLAAEGDSLPPKGPLRALGWVVLHYTRNLGRVLVTALPLMLLAGVLGAILVEVLPWNVLNQVSRVEGGAANVAVLLLAGVFGVLLPVPMAFDVVVCSVLLGAGMPVHVVAVLLVTLGTYSVYAWSLLGTTLSWRIGSLAAVAIFATGVLTGVVAGVVDHWNDLYQSRRTAALASVAISRPPPPALPVGRTAAELKPLLPAAAAAHRVFSDAKVELWAAPFEGKGVKGERAFHRLDGSTVGFKRLPLPALYETMEPGPMHLGSLAAGDINDDGWPDVAVGTPFGVFLYANLGGKFELQEVDFPAMRSWRICDVALVDLDGDGALDLYFSAWMHGSHVLFNRGGSFSRSAHVELPRGGEVCAASTAFADVDRDGLIDIVTGAATFESWYFYPEQAVNKLWHNRGGGRFEPEALPGPEGDTLSLLFTDLDGDGWPDLLVGNDFDEPDHVYLNDHGKLRAVKAARSPLPFSGMTTMSFDTGDLDNDGKPELYVGQIAMGKMGELPKRLAPPVMSCGLYTDMADISRCTTLARFQAAVTRGRDTWTVGVCDELTDPAEKRDCAVMAYHWTRILLRIPASGADKAAVQRECATIPADFTLLRDVCDAMAHSPMDYNQSHKVYTDELPSVAHHNLMFALDGKRWSDATDRWKAGYGGWTWNARFADVDNDGWQDLFIVQGTRLRLYNPSNVLYRNQGGTKMEEITRAAGVEDHLPTAASLFVDYDEDGNLDILTYPFQLTPVMWRNEKTAGPGMEVRLDDRRTLNRWGVGARVRIHSADGRLQIRDIKASGGHQSHDALVARFGLGDWKEVISVDVIWPDGETSEMTGAFQSGRYRVVRRGD